MDRMGKSAIGLVFGVGLWLACAATAAADNIYVDDDAPIGGDGQSWDTAFRHLRDALDYWWTHPAIDELHVAGGIYKPDQSESGAVTPGNRALSFSLTRGLILRGGYAGLADPNHPDTRNVPLYETVLSGDLAGDDEPGFVNYDENSYHVVTVAGVSNFPFVEGVTISGGNANGGTSSLRRGGGVYNSNGRISLYSCVIRDNFAGVVGGGISSTGSDATLDVSGSTIRGNHADKVPLVSGGGGGISASGERVFLVDCDFVENTSLDAGGAVSLGGTGRVIVDFCNFVRNYSGRHAAGLEMNSPGLGSVRWCTFSENTAASSSAAAWFSFATARVKHCVFERNVAGAGSVITVQMGDVRFRNCTIAYNTAGETSAVLFVAGTTAITNSILWGNRAGATGGEAAQLRHFSDELTVSHNCIEGLSTYAGNGNIEESPRFIDAAHGDLHLQTCSPLVGAGDPNFVPDPNVPFDIDGHTTPTASVLDIGADEVEIFDANGDAAHDFCPCPGDLDNDFQVTLTDLGILLANYDTGMWSDQGDINEDGEVNLTDLGVLLGRYGFTCP